MIRKTIIKMSLVSRERERERRYLIFYVTVTEICIMPQETYNNLHICVYRDELERHLCNKDEYFRRSEKWETQNLTLYADILRKTTPVNIERACSLMHFALKLLISEISDVKQYFCNYPTFDHGTLLMYTLWLDITNAARLFSHSDIARV